MDILVRGGTVVLESGPFRADVLVRSGKVAGLLQQRKSPELKAQVIDATGALVLPGGVDVHTHIGIKFGEFQTRDDFATATRAAAFGGTTSLLEFAFPEPGEDPGQAVERRISEASGQAVIDFGFHAAIVQRADADALAGVERAAKLGAPSVKVFTAYRGLMMLELGDILAVMREAVRSRSLVMVHAETEALVERATGELRERGIADARHHSLARPAIAELDAARSVLRLAEESGAAVYLVHVTLPEVAAEIGRARASGVRAFGETCPHYLLLDDSVYSRAHGERFVCSPPIRAAGAARGLWRCLGSELTGIHSDHCCFDSSQKKLYASDSSRIPPGLPGVETRLPLLISAALSGRLSMADVVRLCSSEPARLFGMAGKGSLLPGMDGDLIVVDPRPRRRLNGLHMSTDYTPFEGMEIRGRIETVVAGGEVLVSSGRWAGEKPSGRYIHRRRLEA
jgi:dihydropyrimidinase